MLKRRIRRLEKKVEKRWRILKQGASGRETTEVIGSTCGL
jgi:hypothetical protein